MTKPKQILVFIDNVIKIKRKRKYNYKWVITPNKSNIKMKIDELSLTDRV